MIAVNDPAQSLHNNLEKGSERFVCSLFRLGYGQIPLEYTSFLYDTVLPNICFLEEHLLVSYGSNIASAIMATWRSAQRSAIYGLLNAETPGRWTHAFLATTAATSLTGFLSPLHSVTPAQVLDVLSLIALEGQREYLIGSRFSNFARAVLATGKLQGRWR
jgi:hypothetical protein